MSLTASQLQPRCREAAAASAAAPAVSAAAVVTTTTAIRAAMRDMASRGTCRRRGSAPCAAGGAGAHAEPCGAGAHAERVSRSRACALHGPAAVLNTLCFRFKRLVHLSHLIEPSRALLTARSEFCNLVRWTLHALDARKHLREADCLTNDEWWRAWWAPCAGCHGPTQKGGARRRSGRAGKRRSSVGATTWRGSCCRKHVGGTAAAAAGRVWS